MSVAVLFATLCVCSIADQPSDDFTVAIIPDTQYYCDLTTGGTPEMYYAQTEWLISRAQKDNIRFAIHLGDLVQNPDIESEWRVADRAQKTLEWIIPYSVLPGNHDLGEASYYDRYFGPSRFSGQPFYGGHKGATNRNNYCFFEGGGMEFLVLNLEFDPSPDTLQWAAKVVESHPRHRIILATHAYLTRKGRGTIGELIWNQLVRNHDNIFMVLCGHVPGYAHQTSVNDAGQPVIEILTDYQWEPDGLTQPPLGGDGWLNTMRFAPSENKIYFRSYSPHLDQWRTSPLHQYVVDYSMNGTGLCKKQSQSCGENRANNMKIQYQ